NNPGEREKITEYCHLTLRDAVKRAEDIGCTMVLENIEDKDPHIRVALADSFKSPAVAVSIDTGHAYYAHGSTGAPPVDYFVHAAGNRLQHVH
ncbi:sugar phosphate isomerase/epimerase, partial [Mesorhizobium sp. M1C.F.Ca.ET.212.01.1.1]